MVTSKRNFNDHREIHMTGQGKYLKSRVYGGLDGVVTTFAVVAGVIGAGLSSVIILILGFANLIADGISMAIGDYLSMKSANEYYDLERKREKMEVDISPSSEKKEMVEVYEKKGFSKKDSMALVSVLSRNKELWIDTMMHEELGLSQNKGFAAKHGINTFLAFLLFGFIPLLFYVVSGIFDLTITREFMFTCILAGISMFILGSMKSKFTGKIWYKSGFETLLIGGIAASSAYLVGHFLAQII